VTDLTPERVRDLVAAFEKDKAIIATLTADNDRLRANEAADSKAMDDLCAERDRWKEAADARHAELEAGKPVQLLDTIDRLRAELREACECAGNLLTKMDRIMESDAYKGQVTMAFVHGYRYEGENWVAEVAAMRALLARQEKP
jgi:hypothetical protein